ncbi:tetratricopeptide repeat protein, partial [Actinomadura rubrobrunea]
MMPFSSSQGPFNDWLSFTQEVRAGRDTFTAGRDLFVGLIPDVPARVPRSTYLSQVRQIFPGELEGREAELAELAEFCTREHGPSYVWWQGPAWAGKSALMATFVQNPPPGVRVVSFFITARWGGYNDRTAFLNAMVPQLAEIAEQALPMPLPETHLQGWFLWLVDEAAQACASRGERLALVVDGLDEDRGVTRGSSGHSIAALLPGDPPAGVRVIVAGRPNPPVPSDVPDWHPLRASEIVRPLEPSPAATAIRDHAERELDGLLDGGGLGRELLGLLVTADGGLSGEDLAELTGQPVGEIERILKAVTGRSFAPRGAQWGGSGSRRVFVLAHEELVQAARCSLSTEEIARWREALHDWAERYRRQGWPPGTPEYLLRGYLSMLRDAGDLERMRALVTDWARLDRMLDVSGGDAAALADLTTVQEYIRDQDDPDLTASLHLAWTRHHLVRRNSHIPADLPAAWVLLGNPNRAEALARSIANPHEQTIVLGSLTRMLAEGGEVEWARQVAATAERTARAITNPQAQASALSNLVRVLAQVGEVHRARQVAATAEKTARAITNPQAQASALNSLVRVLAQVGEVERAENVARALTNPQTQAQALSDLIRVLAEAGEAERAENIARAITNPHEQISVLNGLARMLIQVEEGKWNRQVATTVERVALSIPHSSGQASVLSGLALVLAEDGEAEWARRAAITAERSARAIPSPHEQASVLIGLAQVLAELGEMEQARQVAATAEKAARTIPGTSDRVSALNNVARVLARLGDLEQSRQITTTAQETAGAIPSPHEQASVLIGLARVLAELGDTEQARQVAATAEKAARTIRIPHTQTSV